MARLLFTVWPYPTHLHPFIALAEEACRRGHEVAFYTGGDALPVLAREGFRCFPFRDLDWGLVAQTVDDLIAGRQRPSRLRKLWPRFLVETVPAQVRDLAAVLAGFRADVLVCDLAMWAPILILHERTGIPVAAFSHVAHCILPGPDGPTQGVALPRKRSTWQSWYATIAAGAATVITARTRRRANGLRRQFGLAPLGMSVNRFSGTLPLYLVPNAPEFDSQRRDLPPAVRYVGACLWDKHKGDPAPSWLAEIPKHQPIVLVDEGALFTHEPQVLELAARGLAGLRLTVLLLAGKGRDVTTLKLGSLAPNVMLKAHAALSDVLPLASVLVTNGNSGSVVAALQAGLPVVVLPSIWDQAEMAWRVEETGAGVRISPWRATPARLRKAVIAMLEEPSYRRNAAAMGAALDSYGGVRRAVEEIEQLMPAVL